MPHVINSRALTGEKPCINNAIHALLIHGYATFNMLVPGLGVTRCVLPCPRTGIFRANSVRATSVKRRNKLVQKITRKVANVSSFYAIIATEHGFSIRVVLGRHEVFSGFFLFLFFSVRLYSRPSLSRIPSNSLKYFEISIPRHLRFA